MGELASRGLGSRRRSGAGDTEGSPFDQALAAVIEGNAIPDFLSKRKFVFLVDPNQDLAPADTKIALRALRGLIDHLDSSCLFVFDESNLEALRLEFSDAIVLVVLPLDLAAVRAYLASSSRPSDKRLRKIIDQCALGDLASALWLLSQMRSFVLVTSLTAALRQWNSSPRTS